MCVVDKMVGEARQDDAPPALETNLAQKRRRAEHHRYEPEHLRRLCFRGSSIMIPISAIFILSIPELSRDSVLKVHAVQILECSRLNECTLNGLHDLWIIYFVAVAGSTKTAQHPCERYQV